MEQQQQRTLNLVWPALVLLLMCLFPQFGDCGSILSASGSSSDSSTSWNPLGSDSWGSSHLSNSFPETTTPPSALAEVAASLVAGRSRSCDILMAIDEPLWDLRDRNMTHFVETSKYLVQHLNTKFIQQVFLAPYDDLYFRLARVQVLFGSCDVFVNENCTEQRNEFLSEFDGPRDFSDFCVAYLLTYRDFHNGTAGLARLDGACLAKGNAGFVTLLNYENERSLEQTAVTLAHEVAHSFNAVHDDELGDDYFDPDLKAKCNNQTYIMQSTHDTATDSDPKFSECSIDSIRKKLAKLKEDSEYDKCFKANDPATADDNVEESLCGDGIVDPGEECDCGTDEHVCYDRCCYPAHIQLSDRLDSRPLPHSNFRFWDNQPALSCMRHTRRRCREPPPLVYGVYVPLIVIALAVLIIGIVLRHDWKRDKKLFKHITDGNVRIVRPTGESR